MKQIIATIGIIFVLLVILFALSQITVPTTPTPQGKVGTQDADPALVEACNRILAVATFEAGAESDMFMSSCLRGEVNFSDYGIETPIVGSAETFSGTLTEVNTGCFADAECSVTVDGKHVTVLKGWNRDIVGSVIGGDNSIGGLEAHIGSEVEVYAQKLADGTYTLYGDTGYYVKTK